MSKEAMKLALEALKELVAQTETGLFAVRHDHVAMQDARQAITALREALAEQPARPYRLLQDNGSKYFGDSWDKAEQPAQQALDKMAENARELGIQIQPAQQEPVALAHKHINATLAAFGPGEAISMTKETWAKLREAMSVLIDQSEQQQEPVAWIEHEWSGTGLRHLHFEKREPAVRDEVVNPIWTPLYTSPPAQRKPAQQQEPVAWRNAALRVGEDLCSVGPFGYYDMTAEQWLDWALSVVTVHAPPRTQPPAQRTWVGLTDEEVDEWTPEIHTVIRAIEAKLRRKNEDRN